MKMLFIHCDYFSYLTTKPTKMAEEIPNGCKSCGFKNALVIFVTAEKCDAENPSKVIDESVTETIKKANQLGVKNLVVFPFAHLSEQVSDPDTATKIMKEIHDRLVSLEYLVDKAPFGWEKVFSLTSKGHPLAESARTIRF